MKTFVDLGRAVWETTCLHPLLIESLRVRKSSVRADGMEIGGSIFAQSVTNYGRMRLKYAQVAGGFSLFGSRLRGIEASRRNFDDVIEEAGSHPRFAKLRQIATYRKDTYGGTVSDDERKKDRLAYGADGYALDVSEARFGGSVRIGEPRSTTRINGIIAATRAHIDGELLFDNVRFSWQVRASEVPQEDDPHYKVFPPGKAKFLYWDKIHKGEVDVGISCAVILGNATITDSVSFNGADGVQGVLLRGARINGDLTFFDDVKRCDNTDTTTDFLFRVERPATGLTGRILMQGCEIAGDCKLLFHRERGPFIIADNARIGNLLHITEAVGSDDKIDLSPAAFDRRAKEDQAEFVHYQREAHQAWNNSPAWEKFINKRSQLPSIRLKNARATIFNHVPAAWPEVGRLIIAGFRYQSTSSFGPLAPHPFKHDQYERPRIRIMLWALVRLGLGLWLATSYYAFADPLSPDRLVGWHYEAGPGLRYLGILLTIAGAYLFARAWKKPNEVQSLPMAMAYFDLQRLYRNRFRTRSSVTSVLRWASAAVRRVPRPGLGGHVYNGIDAFTVTANSLREDGRLVSANLVEKRRLDVRAGYLSWRLHFFSKLMYKMLDWLTGNGFSFIPLGYLTALVVLITAMVANHAVRVGALERSEGGASTMVQYAEDGAQRLSASKPTPLRACNRRRYKDIAKYHIEELKDINARAEKRNERLRLADKIRERTTKLKPEDIFFDDCAVFSPIAYAIDTVIPTADTGEHARWEFSDKKPWDPTFAGVGIMSHKSWLIFAHIVGLGLFGLFLTGLSTRFGSVVSRYID